MQLTLEETDKLISLIKERQALWDKIITFYSSKSFLDRLWKEVEIEMNIPMSRLKVKWKSLRDFFRTEMRKVRQNEKSKWVHFDKLLFLKNDCEILICNSRLVDLSDATDIDQEIIIEDNIEETIDMQENNDKTFETEASNKNSTTKKKRTVVRRKCTPPMSAVERRKKAKEDMIDRLLLEIMGPSERLTAMRDEILAAEKTRISKCRKIEMRKRKKRSEFDDTVEGCDQTSTQANSAKSSSKNSNFGDDDLFIQSIKYSVRDLTPDRKIQFRHRVLNLLKCFSRI